MQKPQRRQQCETGVCPSELQLDLHNMGALEPAEHAELEPKIASCEGCLARMELRRQGLDAFAEVDQEALKKRLQRSLPANDTGRAWTVPALVVASLAISAAATVMLVPRSEDSVGELRTKGSGLRVYRERDGKVSEAFDQDIFHAGDRVRFSVVAPKKNHVMVFGVEIPKKVSQYYPPPPSTDSRAIDAPGLLPGAIRLNEFVGQEHLFLVDCPRAFSAADIGFEEERSPRIPDGCSVSRFRMQKE